MYSENIKEEFTIRRGKYFWLFVALVVVFLLYMVVDCFDLFGSSSISQSSDCGCDGSVVQSTESRDFL